MLLEDGICCMDMENVLLLEKNICAVYTVHVLYVQYMFCRWNVFSKKILRKMTLKNDVIF